jgi:hypothetical protein
LGLYLVMERVNSSHRPLKGATPDPGKSQLRHAQNITNFCGIAHKNNWQHCPNVPKLSDPYAMLKAYQQTKGGHNDYTKYKRVFRLLQ